MYSSLYIRLTKLIHDLETDRGINVDDNVFSDYGNEDSYYIYYKDCKATFTITFPSKEQADLIFTIAEPLYYGLAISDLPSYFTEYMDDLVAYTTNFCNKYPVLGNGGMVRYKIHAPNVLGTLVRFPPIVLN
jgi:hypothetical protein